MIPVPFANPIGPESGPNGDGVIHGVLPMVVPVAAVSSAASIGGSRILRGNADADGNITYVDVTEAANNDTANDVTLFDTVNPTNDVLLVELVLGDTIESIDFYQTTAGAFGGIAVADVYYKASNGTWINASNITTPNLSATGVKRVQFSPISYGDLGLVDHPIDPRNASQIRALFVRFTGISGVTTAPAFSRIWKRRTPAAAKAVTSFTALVAQGASPNFAPFQSVTLLPLAGDTSLMGFSAPWAKLRVRLVRRREPSWSSEIIYSKGNGQWGVMQPANYRFASAAAGTDELFTLDPGANPQTYDDVITPPSDWATDTITDSQGNTSTLYWFGWRYLADAAAPAPVLLASIWAQPFVGTNVVGVRSTYAGTYTRATVLARDPATSESLILVANTRTGQSAVITVPANDRGESTAISLASQPGDEFVFQQLVGDNLINLADGLIELT